MRCENRVWTMRNVRMLGIHVELNVGIGPVHEAKERL